MKVLPKAARDLRRAAALTRPWCERCTGCGPARCCSDVFCRAVESGLVLAGLEVPEKPWQHGARFLGRDGCVVPPEHRPGCSGYGCAEVPASVVQASTRLLHGAIKACPTVDLLSASAAVVSRTLLKNELLRIEVLKRSAEIQAEAEGR